MQNLVRVLMRDLVVGFTFTTYTIISCYADVGGASNLSAVIPVGCRSLPLGRFLLSVVKLQRWWKGLLLQKLMTKSAIVIQSCTRGWIARRKASVQRYRIIVIQVSILYYPVIL